MPEGEGQITRALRFPAALLFVNSALFADVSEYWPVMGRIFPYARGPRLACGKGFKWLGGTQQNTKLATKKQLLPRMPSSNALFVILTN